MPRHTKQSLLAIALALGACAAPYRQVPHSYIFAAFEPTLHDPYVGNGPHQLDGQAFLRQQGGSVVTCAGSTVMAMPATAFMKEFLGVAISGGQPHESQRPPEKYRGLVRSTQCDAQGNFTLVGLPPGRWIVATAVEWRVGSSSQGGTVQREVEIPFVGRLLLSDQDRKRP